MEDIREPKRKPTEYLDYVDRGVLSFERRKAEREALKRILLERFGSNLATTDVWYPEESGAISRGNAKALIEKYGGDVEVFGQDEKGGPTRIPLTAFLYGERGAWLPGPDFEAMDSTDAKGGHAGKPKPNQYTTVRDYGKGTYLAVDSEGVENLVPERELKEYTVAFRDGDFFEPPYKPVGANAEAYFKREALNRVRKMADAQKIKPKRKRVMAQNQPNKGKASEG